jgi:hypothetical protein
VSRLPYRRSRRANPKRDAEADHRGPWTITFVAEFGERLPPIEVRVRRFLKFMLRRFGLRCIDVSDGSPKPRPQQSDDPDQMPLF